MTTQGRTQIGWNVRITRDMFAESVGESHPLVLAQGVREAVESGLLRYKGDDLWDVFGFTTGELDEIDVMLAGQVVQ